MWEVWWQGLASSWLQCWCLDWVCRPAVGLWDPGALGELFSLTYTPFAHLIALGCRLLKCMAIPCWIWSPTLNLASVAGTHATHLVLVNLALQDDRSYPCHLGTGPEPVGKNVLRIGNLGNVGNLQRIVGAFSRGKLHIYCY